MLSGGVLFRSALLAAASHGEEEGDVPSQQKKFAPLRGPPLRPFAFDEA